MLEILEVFSEDGVSGNVPRERHACLYVVVFKMAQEFKSLRNTALANRDIAAKKNNTVDSERFDKEQNKFHKDMMAKTEQAQLFQLGIDELAIVYNKVNKACDAKHQEMLFIREKSQRFHDDLTKCIEQIESIKAKYDIDYFEFSQEEEE